MALSLAVGLEPNSRLPGVGCAWRGLGVLGSVRVEVQGWDRRPRFRTQTRQPVWISAARGSRRSAGQSRRGPPRAPSPPG